MYLYRERDTIMHRVKRTYAPHSLLVSRKKYLNGSTIRTRRSCCYFCYKGHEQEEG